MILVGTIIPIENMIKVPFFLVSIICSIMLFSALQIMVGSLTFWTYRTNTLLSWSVDIIGELIKYPIIIFSKPMQMVLTYILPIYAINELPMHFLLKDSVSYGSLIWILLCSILFFFLSLCVWNCGLKKYRSAGG